MTRIRIDAPATFPFSTNIPVRITDVNYGGHVGNDTILSIIHEARVQFLAHHGYGEMSVEGVGLIMRDVVIEFIKELFYGDIINASVTATEINKLGFDLIYKLETGEGDKRKVAAMAKTAMICYNYEAKKIASLPEKAWLKLSGNNQ